MVVQTSDQTIAETAHDNLLRSLTDHQLDNREHVQNHFEILMEMKPFTTVLTQKLGPDKFAVTIYVPSMKTSDSSGATRRKEQWTVIAERPGLSKHMAAREALFYLIDTYNQVGRRHRNRQAIAVGEHADTSVDQAPNNPASQTTSTTSRGIDRQPSQQLHQFEAINISELNCTKRNDRDDSGKQQKGSADSKQPAEPATQRRRGALVGGQNDPFDHGVLSEDKSVITISDRKIMVTGKGPMAILNEVYPNLVYEMLLERGKCALETFTCRITLNGTSFLGNGRSKKLARSNAALSVLERLYNVDFGNIRKNILADAVTTDFLPNDTSLQGFVDALAMKVKDKFESLVADEPALQKRKVLAGIVMTKRFDLDSARVICATTGTKCVNAEKLSGQGLVLKDCHAEIVARRCLIRYLYDNLISLVDGTAVYKEDDMAVECAPGGDGGYRVKKDVQFHMFISTSPCGDGRVFSIHEGDQNDGNDVHPNRKARGQLRKKIEAGEGTVLINPGPYIQTWDAILSGEPLQTMSCSDKMCRWNVTGVQGALLSCFLEPIYLTSVIVGHLYHSDHLRRALYGRIEEELGNLPAPFHLSRPILTKVSYTLPRMPRKAPFTAFIWYSGLAGFSSEIQEIVNAETGMMDGGEVSKFSRSALFAMWKHIFPSMSKRSVLKRSSMNYEEHRTLKEMLYADAKILAADYMQVKHTISTAFASSGLGLWVTKPYEQDLFE